VRLFQRCLFCRGEFPPNALFGLVPPGEQLAYDPERGRIWSICARCRRWTLTPIEERSDAIDTLERAVTGRAVLLGSTPNVRLYHVEDIAIVRIGAAPLLERSAWRFGREILERATAFRSRRTRVRAAAAGALARVGETFGVLQLDRDWGPSGTADILRWSRFGSVAWDGRSACRHCNSVLHTLHFDATWWLHPRIESDVLVIGVPCTRCDPWSPVNVFDVAGDDALLLLRRVLAYQHVAGADEQGVRQASELIRTPVRRIALSPASPPVAPRSGASAPCRRSPWRWPSRTSPSVACSPPALPTSRPSGAPRRRSRASSTMT
jgi:hypothetical protein